MKKIHYLNLGMAKAGTSAMFDILCQHPAVDYHGYKENYGYSHHNWTLEKYIDYYKNFDVSLNFCPIQWSMEGKKIKELDSGFTHASMVFRKPMAFVHSLYAYTFQQETHTAESFIDMMLETNQLDYTEIVKRWTSLSNRPFLMLFYDDLTSDPKMFYNQIVNFIGIDEYEFDTSKQVNVTKNEKILLVPTKTQVKKINSLVEEFENFSQRELTHWKI